MILPFPEAAIVPISGPTALQAVRDHGQVRSGQRVLITGGGGGIGLGLAQAFAVRGDRVAVCDADEARLSDGRAVEGNIDAGAGEKPLPERTPLVPPADRVEERRPAMQAARALAFRYGEGEAEQAPLAAAGDRSRVILVVEDEDKTITAYRPGGIVCLEEYEPGRWQIDWMVRPELLP